MTEQTEQQLLADIAAAERQVAALRRDKLLAFREALITAEHLAAIAAAAALLPTLSGAGAVAAQSFINHAQGLPGLLDAEIARLTAAASPPVPAPNPTPPAA